VIDAWGVAANGLWIVGLALALAAVSWARWRAAVERPSFRAILRQAEVARALYGGLALFCAGLAATGQAWWEWMLWGGLTLYWTIKVLLQGRASR
jgi:hypothetical protein